MSTMEVREDLLKNKIDEIEKVVQESLMQISLDSDKANITQFLFESDCLNITPPQQEPPMMSFLTIDSINNYHHGSSIKPGNIKINIKHLINKLPEIVTETVSVISDKTILKVCAAISVWKMLRDVSTIEIKKEQAVVIIALWKNCNKNHIISLEEGYRDVNLLYKQVEANEFTWEQYISIIEELERMNCVELTDDGIWLCEWVSKKYTN